MLQNKLKHIIHTNKIMLHFVEMQFIAQKLILLNIYMQ